MRSVLALFVALLGILPAATADAWCFWNCNTAKTKYPIVLAHGMAGFDELFGVYEYWYGIPGALRDKGATVFVTEVSQFNSTEVRGEQLIDQIETITAITGKPQREPHRAQPRRARRPLRGGGAARSGGVGDFGGHAPQGCRSGGLSSRTTSKGARSPRACWPTSRTRSARCSGCSTGSSNPQDAIAALGSLSSAGAATFNASYPQGVPGSACGEGAAVVNGIRYYSWGGTGVLTNVLDISDAALGLTSLFYGEANDGLVGRCSSHLGDVIRDNYYQNHLDEVNQVLGLVSIFESNPVTLFKNHANRLKNLGL